MALSGVKSGALNFPKMLRHLQHRTNQVKDVNFYRKPLFPPSTVLDKDNNKDGTRDDRFRGPPVDFGYTESQANPATAPDWSKDAQYYETTWALDFKGLKGLQNPKISLNNEVGLAGQSSKGRADFIFPSYEIIKKLDGFGGNQTSRGRAAGLVLGHGAQSQEQGEYGAHLYVGMHVGTDTSDMGLSKTASSSNNIFSLQHFNVGMGVRVSNDGTIIKEWPDGTSYDTPATEVKVGDVLVVDSRQDRIRRGGAKANQFGGPVFLTEITPAFYYAGGGENETAANRIPADGTTITLVDAEGTTVTFETDLAGNGVSGSNIAITPDASSTAQYAYAFCEAVNASSIKITAYNWIPTYNGSRDSPYFSPGIIVNGTKLKRTNYVYLQQDLPCASNTVPITFSNNDIARHWGADNEEREDRTDFNLTVFGEGNGTDGSTVYPKGFFTTGTDNSPEQLLVTKVIHTKERGQAVPNSSITYDKSSYTNITCIRGYNGTEIEKHLRIDEDMYENATAGSSNGPWSNHYPFLYLIKRGYASAILDVQNSGSVDETITLVSTDGTSKTYTCKATADYANNQWSRAGADHGVASFKAAVEHASGHNGKIKVQVQSYTGAQNPWTVILSQTTSGTAGNTTITEGLTGWTITNQFTGGSADTNVVENGTTLTLEDAKGNSHTFTTDNTLKEYESTYDKIGTNLSNQNPYMWNYSIYVALLKATKTTFKNMLDTNASYIKNPDDFSFTSKLQPINWYSDDGIEGSATTALLDMSVADMGQNSDLSLTEYVAARDDTVQYDENGKKMFVYGDFNFDGGDQQFTSDGTDLYTSWHETNQTEDARGQYIGHIEWSACVHGDVTINQNTVGAAGNTEVTGNSFAFSNVGHWWSGVGSGHPAEQNNRRFFDGTDFKGKIRQQRAGPSSNTFQQTSPYFYEFMSGDIISETSKEVYRFPDVDNVKPQSNIGEDRAQRLSHIGIRFPTGTFVSGEDAERIKFKFKVTQGEESLRTSGGLWVQGHVGGGQSRGRNSFRSTGRDVVGQGTQAGMDYSVDISGFFIYFTQNNVIYKIKYVLSNYINCPVGKWMSFDIPLQEGRENYFYREDFTDGKNKDFFSSKETGSSSSSLERIPGRRFFSVWHEGLHQLCRISHYRGPNINENSEDWDQHISTESLNSMPIDSSNAEGHYYSSDAATHKPSRRIEMNPDIRRCLGTEGSSLGRNDSGLEGNNRFFSNQQSPIQNIDSYYGGRPVDGYYDFGLLPKKDESYWLNFNHNVRVSFKDVVIYKPKVWQVKEVQEYDSEYVKVSCERIGHDDNSAKRRAYG